MKRALPPLALALLACSTPHAQPSALYAGDSRITLAVVELERWEAYWGPASACWSEVTRLRFIEQDVPALSWSCESPTYALGCFRYEPSGPVIRLATRSEYVLRHELKHWLLRCSGTDETGDLQHEGPYWRAR